MSYRNNKQKVQDEKKWKAFCQAHQAKMESIGLPESVIETHEQFEDLLIHGYLDHHDDETGFHIKQLSATQRKQFIELLNDFFADGYYNPGLMVQSDEEREGLAKRYPTQFHY